MNHPAKSTRRDFLRFGAALAGGALALPRIANAAGKKIPIGLQLYSVRHQCEKDLPGVIKAVADMGYKGVEFAGYYDRSASELRKLLDDHGLVCCGTHAKRPTINPDQLEATIEFNKTLGNKYLVVPSISCKTKAAWLEEAKYFNEAADRVKSHGMLVGYHAHGHDFQPIEGEIPWHLFFGNTKKEVIMQLDTGNCLGGGADPVEVLKKYPGRATTIHLKEHGGPPEAVIGGGDVKWAEIFDFCEKEGATEWYIVEHERKQPDPLAEVKRCLEALKGMGKA